MSYRLEFTIQGLPRILTNGQQSWRSIHYNKRQWKLLVAQHVDARMRPPAPLKKASIICTRCSSRASDYDNRVASFKAVIDGLVEIGVLEDDNDEMIVMRQYNFEKVSPKNSHIRVVVEEVD